MNLAAALIRPPSDRAFHSEDRRGALAYVISIEKIIGREDAVIVRISSILRKFVDEMVSFDWNPSHAPNLTSTAHSSEVIYLVKKIGEPFAYSRVKDF